MLLMHTLYLLDVISMCLINLLLSWPLAMVVFFTLNSTSNQCDKLDIVGQKEPRFRVKENDSRNFEFVEPESELYEILESPKKFVLIQRQNWVNCIIMLKGVFDKSFSLLNIHPELIGNRKCCLLESTRNQTDISALSHESSHVRMMHSLNPPQPQYNPNKRYAQHKPARHPNHIRQRTLLIVHIDQHTHRQHSMRVKSKQTFLCFRNLLFVDQLHILESLADLYYVIDKVDVLLVAFYLALQQNYHSIKDEHRIIESEQSVSTVNRTEIENKIEKVVVSYGHLLLMLTEVGRNLLLSVNHNKIITLLFY